MTNPSAIRTVFVDADACPVKDEIYRVAKRLGWRVTVVANAHITVPQAAWIAMQVVPEGPDAADDWIAAHAAAGDLVVTADIPLASRCLDAGAQVLRPRGKPYTPDNIGAALATRELMDNLRGANQITGGPAPFGPKDRSQFLQQIDRMMRTPA